ncbi:MAG: hypothetical protein U0517_00580 [Candidatus Andersenbacteria bacterium]
MSERPSYNPEKSAVPKSPETLPRKGGPEVQGRGVFYDTYEVFGNEAEQGTYALKVYKLDRLHTETQARDLFAKQAGEYETMKPYFSPELLPPPTFILADKDTAAFDQVRKNTKNVYSYTTFGRNMASAFLQGRASIQGGRLEREPNWVQKAGTWLGTQVERLRGKREKFFGAILQEYIRGVPFQTVLTNPNLKQDPQYKKLRTNVQSLIEGLRRFHQNEAFTKNDPQRPDHPAFTWHGLRDDNVIVETRDGMITGRVAILDTNYSQRPDERYQKGVIAKLEKEVLSPLEEAFELKDGEQKT